jgi:hypothetical protein
MAVLHVVLILWLPQMARSKDGLPPYFGQWIAGSIGLSIVVLAIFAFRVGNWYDRLVAAAFCALPVWIVFDIFEYGLPRG